MKDKIKEICERLNREQASVHGATNELFDLFSVVRQSEQLFCPKCGRHERIIGCSVYDYLCDDCGNVWAK